MKEKRFCYLSLNSKQQYHVITVDEYVWTWDGPIQKTGTLWASLVWTGAHS